MPLVDSAIIIAISALITSIIAGAATLIGLRLSARRDAFAELQKEVVRLQEAKLVLETRYDVLREKYDKVSFENTEQRSEIIILKARVRALETDVARLDTEKAALGKRLADLQNTINLTNGINKSDAPK
jgi:chromosome segregation ATPase